MENRAAKNTPNRTRWCNIRLTEGEYQVLKSKLTTTTCRQVSDYVRKVLFEKPITVKHRDQSMDDFMKELIAMRTELNALGNNFNQVVKKINSVKGVGEMEIWLPVAEGLQKELLQQIGKIQERINQFSEQWLPK
jgi:MobC-like protein